MWYLVEIFTEDSTVWLGVGKEPVLNSMNTLWSNMTITVKKKGYI